MKTCENLAIAYANDDDYHDDECPGCGGDITGWQANEAHFPPSYRAVRTETWEYHRRYRGMTWPWTKDSSLGICPWTHDYLVARAFRRRYIKEHANV
jgi:hypothetical protein